MKDKMITYDLLWTLFKPGTMIHCKCIGSEAIRCIRFVSGEYQSPIDKPEHFYIEGRCIDYDGKAFGETATATGILKFQGSRRIDQLDAFPLKYHPEEERVLATLLDQGKKFIKMVSAHHKEFNGVAFYHTKDEVTKRRVKGRIMVDTSYFYEMNANYQKPRFDDTIKSTHRIVSVEEHFAGHDNFGDNDLLICSPTVMGFSLVDKKWCWSPNSTFPP
jgi:hypothetical protein